MRTAIPGGRSALALTALCFALGGCAASAPNRAKTGGAPPAVHVQSSQKAPAAARQGAPARSANPGSRSARLGLAEHMEPTSAPRPPPLPCELRVLRQGAAVALDFHAEKASPERVREQVQELERFLNAYRGDEEASSAPGGRAEPATFAVRRILAAGAVASSEPLPDGARLLLTPTDPARLEVLHARVLWHAADLLPGLPLTGKVCPDLPPQVEEKAASAELGFELE